MGGKRGGTTCGQRGTFMDKGDEPSPSDAICKTLGEKANRVIVPVRGGLAISSRRCFAAGLHHFQ